MTKQDIIHNAAGAPPVAIAGMQCFGYPIADWVQVMAGLWLGLQIGWWFLSKIKLVKKGRRPAEQESRDDPL